MAARCGPLDVMVVFSAIVNEGNDGRLGKKRVVLINAKAVCRKKCNRANQILFYAKETSRAYVFTEESPIFFYFCRFFPVEDPQSPGTKEWLDFFFYFSFPSFPLLFPFGNRTVSPLPPLVRVDLSSCLNEMRSWSMFDREAD